MGASSGGATGGGMGGVIGMHISSFLVSNHAIII